MQAEITEQAEQASAQAQEPTQIASGDMGERLSEYLVGEGKLRTPDLLKARRLIAEGADTGLVTLLMRLGLVSERDVAEGLAKLLDLRLLSAEDYPEDAPADTPIAIRFLKHCHMVVVAADEHTVSVAMTDPTDAFARSAMALATGREIRPLVGVQSEIDNAIERMFGGGRSAMGQIVENLDEGDAGGEEDVEQLRDLASEAPVIRLVNLVMQRAVESRASDIHIEPFENRLKVRYRIDGVLKEVEAPPARSTAAVISRIKIMAKLNIAERRLPQDGRILLRVQGKELDLRVSTVPTAYGESVVMRLLDRESVVFDFAKLGFGEAMFQRFRKVLEMPHGILLVTGPTGSGKTTTLYTALQRLNTPSRKIITVEDPIEYQLEGVNQIQVKPAIGLTFSGALRSIVRQDPDVIMIGEMRDLETARIAIQSALTGHLVLSTIHTNDAAGGVTRLLDMGVEDYLLTSTVNGIMAQRLVRQLCPECKQGYAPLPEMVKELGLRRFSKAKKLTLYKAVGCEACSGTGFRGRTSIHELLVMSDAVRRLVMQHSGATLIQQQACDEGMITMQDDGMAKCLAGITAIEEVLRITGDST